MDTDGALTLNERVIAGTPYTKKRYPNTASSKTPIRKLIPLPDDDSLVAAGLLITVAIFFLSFLNGNMRFISSSVSKT
jgi:hypothetical protein